MKTIGSGSLAKVLAAATALLLAGCATEETTSVTESSVTESSVTESFDTQPRLAVETTTTETVVVPETLPTAIVDGGERWSAVFDEPFDGDSLGAVWSTCYWWQVDGGCTIASNDELEWYRPEGVSIADGVLELEAVAESQRTSDGAVLPFRSGMVSTGQRDNDVSATGFEFTFGYVEAMVRFPEGAGTWPAVWLLSADKTSLPEIDIVERYGNTPTVKGRVHQRVDGQRQTQGIEATITPTESGWQHFGVLWANDRVEFYLNDELTGTIDDAS